MKFWLVKQEPEKYSFDDLLKEGKTEWTGVRNFQARNNLLAMRNGDKVLFYHSVSEKAVVGIAEICAEAAPDSTDETGKWSAVFLKPSAKLHEPVTLERIKADEDLAEISLIKQSRLSVMPLTEKQFEKICRLGKDV